MRLAALAGLGLGVCVLVNVVDPNDPGALGVCPFRRATGGLDCPGCGTLRATRALSRGDLLTALDHNLLTVLLLPLLAAMLASAWWAAGHRTRTPWHPPAWAGRAIAVAVPAFWVLRITPAGAWFASGAV